MHRNRKYNFQSQYKMLPYSHELFLRNSHNYGIMKTEAVFGFGPPHQNNYFNHSFNRTETMDWIFGDGVFQKRSLQVEEPPTEKSITIIETPKSKETKATKTIKEMKKNQKRTKKNSKRKSKKVNKCIIKFMKEGQGQENPQKRKRKREKGQLEKMQKKYMMPVIVGLLAAKSVLIPIVLKALAFTTTKGLMMMLFSTIMASAVAFKGIFSHNNDHNRKDDAKTQVEIIQIPQKSEDHIYYDDEHIRKGDYDIGPIPYIPIGYIPKEAVLNKKSNFPMNDKHFVDPYRFGGGKGNFNK